jgi:hypothetical protein
MSDTMFEKPKEKTIEEPQPQTDTTQAKAKKVRASKAKPSDNKEPSEMIVKLRASRGKAVVKPAELIATPDKPKPVKAKVVKAEPVEPKVVKEEPVKAAVKAVEPPKVVEVKPVAEKRYQLYLYKKAPY